MASEAFLAAAREYNEKMNQQYVKIDKSVLRGLVQAELQLRALFAGGVQDWHFYEPAINSFYGQYLRNTDEITEEMFQLARKRAVDETLYNLVMSSSVEVDKCEE